MAQVLLITFPKRSAEDIGRVIWRLYCESFDFAGQYTIFKRPVQSSVYIKAWASRVKLKMALAELERDPAFETVISQHDHHAGPIGYYALGFDYFRVRIGLWFGCRVCNQAIHIFQMNAHW